MAIVEAILVTFVFTAPVWVPAMMIVYYQITAKNFWQFSLGFLMVLIAAECVALAISVALYRWLSTPWDWPVPD
jgi:hypothetical protein